MSPLIKKEIRLLLPAWIVAMVLAIFTPPIPGAWLLGTSGTPFGLILGLLLLGIASFGQEFSSGSFSTLLSHPMERGRIWNVKTRILFYAFALVFVGWVVHIIFINELLAHVTGYFYPFGMRPEQLFEIRYILLALAIFTGSLWTTLLVRQIVAAFGLTLMVPLVTTFWIEIISDHYNWSVRVCDNVIDGFLVAYSVAGFLWARRLFLHAQDIEWTGGDFSFPWRAKTSGQNLTLGSKRPRHWFLALAWKEILLHQANLLIAALLLALHLSAILIRKVDSHIENRDLKFILESVWVLWLLMPLLIGSAAVAEERKLGVIESQLCHPVSRRFQLAVKFFASFFLSLFLGAAVPSLIESLGLATIPVLGLATLIFVISFYSSTLARTTLQAIGLAMLIFTGLYFYEWGMTIRIFSYGYSYSEPQIGLVYLKRIFSVPALLFVSAWLAYWNFKWLHQNRKVWVRNIIVLLITVASISTLSRSIYFRAWELFMPADPARGPARLNASALPVFSSAEDGISALLPDGRLWTGQIRSYDIDDHGSKHFFPVGQKFVNGSNWTSAARSFASLAAIKSDGTLWDFEPDAGRLAQVGSDTNWLRVADQLWSSGFLLLKNDGTAWYWGEFSDYPHVAKFPVPTRISNGTNFTDLLVRPDDFPVALKSDGSLWQLGIKKTKTNSMLRLFQRPELLDFSKKIRSPYGWVELSTNGDLSYSSDMVFLDRYKFKPVRTVPIGQNEKWIAAASGPAVNPFASRDSLFTIRSDGTLWEWKWAPPDSRFSPDRWANDIYPVQLGNHSDWVALFRTSRIPNGIALALAADGSLWAWNQPSDRIWLAPSRRPQFMGNIFKGSAGSAAAER
jgi:hypothetical protein